MDKKKVPRQVQLKIPAFHTLLIEEYIEICEKIKISLTMGSGEIFGMQLKKNYPHYYSVPCSLPVFSWQGGEIKIEWMQYQNTKNSSSNWVDITEQNGQNESTAMIKYLQFHYNMTTLRKVALQELKLGPRIAIVGSQQSTSPNICKLLLNYAGKYSMNPLFIDLDPENSIFVDGSIGALEFEYKIQEDLYDRPNKLCFYYGNRSIKSSTYLQQVKFLADCVMKRLNKQIKDYKQHGTKQQHPVFASGIIIHCPRYKPQLNKNVHIDKIREILQEFDCTHILNIVYPEIEAHLPPKIESIKSPILEGSDSFLSLPRPQRSKIDRYFNNQSMQIRYNIDDIQIYQLMTQANQNNAQPSSRLIDIRQEAVSKNVVAVLHAVVNLEDRKNYGLIYEKAVLAPIACLARIYGIYENQIVFEVGQQHFLEQFRNHIWVTSVTDQ